MLTLVLGRAGTGKTSLIMNDFKSRIDAGETGLLLIVPEQYSHDAERRLCEICGDKLSLHGEVLSFTRLCGRVFSMASSVMTSGAGAAVMSAPDSISNSGAIGKQMRTLDTGGQMLAMHRAIELVASKLSIYGKTGMRAELVQNLLETVRELKNLRISPESLEKMAIKTSGTLADKLRDLSLILEAYDGILHIHGADQSDRMNLLVEFIGDSSMGESGHIYLDGFNDFTAQELSVIGELLRKNADMTICLTLDPDDFSDSDDGISEVFELPRRTAVKILRLADDSGVGTRTVIQGQNQISNDVKLQEETSARKAPELIILEQRLFGYEAEEFPGSCDAIELYAAPSKSTECEYAAYKTLELVRGGYRWRDIGVMARNWDEYGAVCENVFEKYGIPFFAGGRESVTEKPPIALMDAALEIAASGLEYKQVFRYLKTGLTGVSADDCSELENYVIKWRIRGSLWTRAWKLPPSGYSEEDYITVLERLNALRCRITEPLLRLREGIRGVSEAGVKVKALYSFLEDICLPELLREKALLLDTRGEARLADEYAQLWGVIVNTMENVFAILEKAPLSVAEFRKVFMLTLSSYDVGVIPVSLDRTALGDMAMNRRRDLKCLIILGATDGNMPMPGSNTGAFSDSEIGELKLLGAVLQASREDRLYREMNMLYSAFTLPSQKLIVTYPVSGERPSFIIKKLKATFDITEKTLREEEYMSCAPVPCRELAALSGNTNNSSMALAAREYFTGAKAGSDARSTCADISSGAGRRGNLSDSAAQALYGRELSLSPSRVNRYYSCPFAHFLYSGLRLAPRIASSFDAPEAGTFTHYVLEGVSRDIRGTTGYKNSDENSCRELTSRYIEKYAHEELLDFEGKNARFIYLFRRLEENVQRIVLDMLEELQRSDFEPLSFELDLSEKLAGKGHLRGVIDRVDGWLRDGKQYLRVVDYKTGRKSFDLTNVLHGMDMQMLIYLFALTEYGSGIYECEVAPSGVLYVPARDITLKAARHATEDELKKLRERELRRSGLILNDPDVIEAMEKSEEKKYLPVKTSKGGAVSGDGLVNLQQLGVLSSHVNLMMSRASDDILGGRVECVPYYRSDADNACMYCEYHAVCGFDEEAGDTRKYIRKLNSNDVWAAMQGTEF